MLLPILPVPGFHSRACGGLDSVVVWWLVSPAVGVTVHFKKTLTVTGAMLLGTYLVTVLANAARQTP